MIRLARMDDLSRTQAERPESVLVNSRDCGSAYQLHAGMIDGGQKDYGRRRPENSRRLLGRTRPVKGLDENVRLNKALWHLADTLRASEPLTPDHLRDQAEVSTS